MIEASCDTAFHRTFNVPNFSGAVKGVPNDGDVRSCVNPLTGHVSYVLNAQPGEDHMIRGLSFFVPAPEYSELMHQYLDAGDAGCMIMSLPKTLPPNLCLVNDIHLMLPLRGDDDPTIVHCGEHYVLYTSVDMPVEDFLAGYAQIKQDSIPCTIASGAELQDTPSFNQNLAVDTDLIPGGRYARICVMALDDLANETPNSNVRFFASSFSRHIAAINMTFEDILKNGPIASMVAAALDVWTVRDPILVVFVCDVQQQLADQLGVPFVQVLYKPYNPKPPLKFLAGSFNDDLYNQAMKSSAPEFVGDVALKEMVGSAASKLFAAMKASPWMVPFEEEVMEHRGVTFRVVCGSGGELMWGTC